MNTHEMTTLMPAETPGWKARSLWFMGRENLQHLDVNRGHEPLRWVGRDSVEPTLERSEANEVSIFPFHNGDRDARFARASCVGRVGSTESLPTRLRRFVESCGDSRIARRNHEHGGAAVLACEFGRRLVARRETGRDAPHPRSRDGCATRFLEIPRDGTAFERARVILFLLSCLISSPVTIVAAERCRIEVVEKGSGWPVPLVELRTTHHARFVTDNAGVIALGAPELMGREVWFDVIGHGYEVPKDGFGQRGVRLKLVPGKTLRIEVNRTIIAKRLGRTTGAGLFAESQNLGRDLDWRDNSIDVFGCDSVQNAVHRGKLFWAWGDTVLPNYPLGVFDMTSATTPVQPLKSFEPPLRLKFDYFRDKKGKPRGVAKMPGAGPTWVTGYVSLPDKAGAPRLCGSYIKVRNHLEAYESGLCVWNDAKEEFEQLRLLWTKSEKAPTQPPWPEGHPAFWRDAQGKEWVLFGNPLPRLRCAATFEAWQDASQWEVLEPQKTLVSAKDGQPVKPHTGSIAWNGFRQRWVTVFMEYFGKPSAFGELWYAEADSPVGAWGRAVKVLSHDNYTFYNPRLHPEFTPTNSPILLFEGTYTMQFADKPHPTPRYDYNQIIYRLDLDDSALQPAFEKPR